MSNNKIDDRLDEELINGELLFEENNSISIALSANGWVTKHLDHSPEVITDYGVGNWTSHESVISVYFHCSKSGEMDVSLRCKVPTGKSRLQLSIEKHELKVDIDGDQYKVVNVGKFSISQSGYVKVDMQGVNKTGNYFADVSHLVISGDLVDTQSISYIHEESNKDVYWGRRGPSVHLSYHMPTKDEIEYYYNEVTVPKGYDPIASYFMAIGFDFGYFGIQVLSESERVVLFSVWSPSKTDNPKEIPEELKVKLMSKGTDVTIHDFGGEGSGGKSMLKYMWHSDITYKFLLSGKPDPNDSTHTVYTAWFSEINSNWKLIASFKRPQTHKHLSGFYSFIEDFNPNTGFITRKVLFGNQWAHDITGKWHEVTTARFTGDETASKKVRLDFEAGVENNSQFYLQSCGFFDGKVALLTELKRTENKIHPNISFKELPHF